MYNNIFSPLLMKDKVCLITGGSRGGMLKECAKAYLQHGAKAVVIMARNQENLEKVCKDLSQYGTCVGRTGDVSKMESCLQVVQYVVEEFSRIDVLVNGAAGNFLATAEKLSTNGFKRVLEIDTLGTFNMSQSTLHWNGCWGLIHASAAKAGVDAETKVLATEWGPYGIRVVGLIPGPIEGTEGMERLSDFGSVNDKAKANKSIENAEKPKDKPIGIPRQRYGTIEDIANAALFLASPAADYITGCGLLIDGGCNLTGNNMMFSNPPFVQAWSQAKL